MEENIEWYKRIIKIVKKYTLNWSGEARKEYVGMLYTKQYNYSYIVESLNKFSNHGFKYLKDNKEIILH